MFQLLEISFWVGAALLLGAKANKVRIQLLYKYDNNEFMKNLVPTLGQVRSRNHAMVFIRYVIPR